MKSCSNLFEPIYLQNTSVVLCACAATSSSCTIIVIVLHGHLSPSIHIVANKLLVGMCTCWLWLCEVIVLISSGFRMFEVTSWLITVKHNSSAFHCFRAITLKLRLQQCLVALLWAGKCLASDGDEYAKKWVAVPTPGQNESDSSVWLL